MGTVILPGILALMKAPVLGWAKPVPVNQWRLNNPRTGMMAVAAAGPAINLVMAAVAALALGMLARTYGIEQTPTGLLAFVIANLVNFLTINTFLAFFNLLPIPPFDGSHIVEGLLPRELARSYAGLRRFGMALILLLIVVLPSIAPGFDIIGRFVWPPVQWMLGLYASLASWTAGIAPTTIA